MFRNRCSQPRKFTICRCSFSTAMHLFGLNWHLQPMQRQIYQLTEDNTSGLHLPTDLGLPPLGNTGLEFPDRGRDDGMNLMFSCQRENQIYCVYFPTTRCTKPSFRPAWHTVTLKG